MLYDIRTDQQITGVVGSPGKVALLPDPIRIAPPQVRSVGSISKPIVSRPSKYLIGLSARATADVVHSSVGELAREVGSEFVDFPLEVFVVAISGVEIPVAPPVPIAAGKKEIGLAPARDAEPLISPQRLGCAPELRQRRAQPDRAQAHLHDCPDLRHGRGVFGVAPVRANSAVCQLTAIPGSTDPIEERPVYEVQLADQRSDPVPQRCTPPPCALWRSDVRIARRHARRSISPTRPTASTISSTLWQRKPVSPCRINSGIEARCVAITGVPQARDSGTTLGQGSSQRMGTSSARAWPRKLDFSRSPISPIHSMRPPRCGRTSRSKNSRPPASSEMLPAILSGRPVRWATWIARSTPLLAVSRPRNAR